MPADAEAGGPETKSKRTKSLILMACVFATGLSGIVAEYVMATLASYLLGDAVTQWTLTVSLMLFAMGVGSRSSRHIRRALLDAFVIVELLLSVICAAGALVTYLLAAYVEPVAPVIYTISAAIGLLIGLEIPLVTRLNQLFAELRINISSVMEKDYFGALLGGLIFAFFALPYLGLTYTPILLGTVNFLVASVLFVRFWKEFERKGLLTAGFVSVPALLILLFFLAEPITLFGEQRQYRDRVVYQQQTRYQKIVMTQWRSHFWLYLDGSEQFSSYDEERYHEPLVHPAMMLSATRRRVLILGGGDGLAVREVLKYGTQVKSVTLVDIDPAMTDLARSHPFLTYLNDNALEDPRVAIVNRDADLFLRENDTIFDVILIDLPDPKTVSLARLYSVEFYRSALQHLSAGGTLVTQATSPFFSREAFLCILKTIRSTGVPAVPYHNHIPTMGEWGWVVALKAPDISPETLKRTIGELTYKHVSTRFLSQEAVLSMINFGKGTLRDFETIAINNRLDLMVFRYYQRGAWDLY